jgi:Tfp pilus assembly protein PilO
MKRTPNSTIFLAMIVIALVGGIAINALAYSRVSAHQASLAKVKTELDTEMKVPARFQQSQQSLQEARAGLKHLEQGVSATSYVPTMMRQLEDLGHSCGVEVTAVRPVPPPPAAAADKNKPQAPKPYDTLDIEVKGLAHYSDALRFVSSLDTFPKVVEARTVSLEPDSSGKKIQVGSPKLTMSILLRAFLFKAEGSQTAMTTTGATHAG